MEDYEGYNHMHLNGFADVISKAFLDVVIQPGQKPDERNALHQMLDHLEPENPEKYIITADRGYNSGSGFCVGNHANTPKVQMGSYRNEQPFTSSDSP